MLKFLLLLLLFFAVIYYVFILPFKPRHQVNDDKTQRRRTRGGNVNIDYVPDEKKKARSDNYKGGDYIDYEDVKE